MGAFSSLIPLVILFTVVSGVGYFGYQIYLWSNELADRGQKHMEKKHMSFTKDGGLRVGVKEVSQEEYADRTQRVLVNTWNTSAPDIGKSSSRPSSSRIGSGTSRSDGAHLQTPEHRGSAKRGSSPVPGGF